jgi:PIN domain nuclease of toxin-antitoxin system
MDKDHRKHAGMDTIAISKFKATCLATLERVHRTGRPPISTWEFLLLAERGRVRVRGGVPPVDWVKAALSRAPMHDAPLSREVAVRSRSVRLDHEDPADRFLAATADVYDLTLITADDRLLRAKGVRTLANR